MSAFVLLLLNRIIYYGSIGHKTHNEIKYFGQTNNHFTKISSFWQTNEG